MSAATIKQAYRAAYELVRRNHRLWRQPSFMATRRREEFINIYGAGHAHILHLVQDHYANRDAKLSGWVNDKRHWKFLSGLTWCGIEPPYHAVDDRLECDHEGAYFVARDIEMYCPKCGHRWEVPIG